jgi:DNA-binding CsgD family transcriptional regulator
MCTNNVAFIVKFSYTKSQFVRLYFGDSHRKEDWGIDMQNIFALVEHVIEMFCSRWNQSARLVNVDGRVLVKVAGNDTTEDEINRMGDNYLERARALVQVFGKSENPMIVNSMLTLFPCIMFIPLYENDYFLITGYFVDFSTLEFLEQMGTNPQLIKGIPKYNAEEQKTMMHEMKMTKAIIERLISSNLLSPLHDQSNVYEVLSNREREILLLVRKGLTNAEIARDLFISENTVKSHVSRVFKKLGITRRREIIQL